MDILQKTLDEMEFSFSSNQFSKKARKNGLSKQEISNGIIAIFLHRNAIQGNTRRMWRKSNTLDSPKKIEDKIAEAIDLLKSSGYKILKPINEWIEL